MPKARLRKTMSWFGKMRTKHYCSNHQLLLWTYYCLGGIYTSGNFTLFKRGAYLLLNMGIIFLVSVVGILGYILTADVITVLDTISITFMPSIVTYVLGTIPFITHRFHREFAALFDYLEERAIIIPKEEGRRTSAYGFIKQVDSIKDSLRWLKAMAVICVVYVSVGAVDVMWFCEKENSFRNLQHHMFPMPYLDRIPSLAVFWIFYVIESAIFVYACVAGLPEVTFVALIANEFNNIATVYCERMRSSSQHLTVMVESNGNCNNEILFREFETDLRFFTTEHRRMISMIRLIRPYIEIFDTLLVMAIFFSLLICIYLLLLTDLDQFIKFKQVVAVWCACLYLYPHCELGTKFSLMNEAMILQVYSLPWYYLPPKQRKLVYLLLCQVQRPIRFRAFKIYDVDLVTFPQILNKAYSYVTLLRRSINTGHHSFRT